MPNETRDRVVFAALKLFAEKGYNATSVNEILATAGVNAGSLYYVFPGKQDVLLAVLATYLEGIRPMLLEPAWTGVEDPIERVFALLERYRDALHMTDFLYGCPIGSLALELHEPDPAVRALLDANFKGWTTAIQECFDAARDRLPHDVDTHDLAVFALTTMEGGVMLSRTSRNAEPFDAAVRTFRHYIDTLITNKGAAQ